MILSNVLVLAAPSFVAKPTNTHVLDGNTASLECRAEGFPVPAIAWSKDGGRLPSQDRHIVLPSGALRIIHARPVDEGQYECQAINVLGVSIARTYLTVVPRGIYHFFFFGGWLQYIMLWSASFSLHTWAYNRGR